MKKTDCNPIVAFPIVVLIGAEIALAGNQGGAKAGGLPVFSLCVALVLIWAVRLGNHLFTCIRKVGKDDRFDAIKPAFTTTVRKDFGVVAIIGLLVWLAGFGLEVTADRQNSRFRADPANKGTFIHTGVWAWSLHPDYEAYKKRTPVLVPRPQAAPRGPAES